MGVIIAKVSDYAEEFIEMWAKANKIDTETAIDQILTSVRDEAENKEEH